jgi:hypothetical protein
VAYRSRRRNELAFVGGDDDAFDEVIDAVRDIVDQIEDIPATTLAGLWVKARAVLWCHSGETLEERRVPTLF